VRVTEVDSNACGFGQLFVPYHLSALVVRHALAHRHCNAQQLVRERLKQVSCTGWLRVRQPDQDNQSTGAFDQGAHRACVALTLDEVTFPVPWKLPVLKLGRANLDGQHVRYLATSVLPFAAGHTLVVSMAQASYQPALEFTHRLPLPAATNNSNPKTA